MNRNILVATAWPYANGPLHLGHVTSLIGGDILARYHRLKGDDVLFVSGSDCHGTPIALEAEKRKVSPDIVADEYDKEFRETLIKGLGFSYDLFFKTTDEFHGKEVQKIFLSLLEKDLIYKKKEKQLYCPKCKRFLPNRYIEGECPRCGFDNARGDQCDNCGNLLNPQDLINSKCKICQAKPEERETEHFFFKLSSFEKELIEWVKKSGKTWRQNSVNFTREFIKSGLKDRAITRDIEWGIPIPLEGYEDKRIYVWFEAVSGYLTASKKWAKDAGEEDKWKDFWQGEAWHYYVHGKDNIPFHAIIWPSILLGLGNLKLPDQIISSEYLNFKGKQFSKSRSWGVWLPEFLAKYDPDPIRFYLIANGPETGDSNFTPEDFVLRNNTELLGNLGNFINRVLNFTDINFEGKVPKRGSLDEKDKEFLNLLEKSFGEIGKSIEKGNFREALGKILFLSSFGNKYLDEKEPWKEIKTDKEKAGSSINICLQAINNLRILISPFLPFSSERVSSFLKKEDTLLWKHEEIEEGDIIKKPIPLFKKL